MFKINHEMVKNHKIWIVFHFTKLNFSGLVLGFVLELGLALGLRLRLGTGITSGFLNSLLLCNILYTTFLLFDFGLFVDKNTCIKLLFFRIQVANNNSNQRNVVHRGMCEVREVCIKVGWLSQWYDQNCSLIWQVNYTLTWFWSMQEYKNFTSDMSRSRLAVV